MSKKMKTQKQKRSGVKATGEEIADTLLMNEDGTPVESTEEKSSGSAVKTKDFTVEFEMDVPQLVHDAVTTYAEKFTSETNIVENIIEPIIKRELQKLKPTLVTIEGRKPVQLDERTHKEFENCLFICQHERQLFISGAAGSGKTTLASQIAKAFSLNYAQISCSAGLSEAHLLGRMLFDGTYVPAEFVNLFENGGVFLFDEIDAADSNTLLVINSALANGVLSIPNRKDNTTAVRHDDFICIVSGNTWGSGSYEYHGRNHLDAAFLDRFAVSKVSVGYDTNLEQQICGTNSDLYASLNELRRMVTEMKIKRIVSTRIYVSSTRLMLAGLKIEKIFEKVMTGWSAEELAKIKTSKLLQKYIK